MMCIPKSFWLVTALTMSASSALAQAQPAEAPAKAQPVVLDDVVVTARRAAESLQSVPVAVTALSGEFLEAQNVGDVTTVPRFTPNLTIMQQPASLTAASVFIRGIGNNEPSSVAEQGVGIYLDGVYVARSAGVLFDLVDLERLEVLRGPQGTLFGRNTVGGAVQLVSRPPAIEPGLELKAGYASFNDTVLRARLDTGNLWGAPVRASISAMHRKRDGYVDNRLQPDSNDPGALKADAVILALQADLDKLTVNYSFDYNEREGVPPYFQMLAVGATESAYFGRSAALGGDPFMVGPGRRDPGMQAGFVDRQGDVRYDSRARIWGHGLTLSYEMRPWLTLKSITGYRSFFQDAILTMGGNGNLRGVVYDPTSPTLTSVQPVGPYNGNNAPQDQWQFSQELQALGGLGNVSYVGGLYYFEEEAKENNRQALTLVTAPAFLPFINPAIDAAALMARNPGLDLLGLNLSPVQAFSGKTKSVAAFGQISWRPQAFDDRLELTSGLRYTKDKKGIVLAGDVNPHLSGKVSYNNTSWLLSANYKFTDRVMAYARASTGYRSGGISPRATTINIFAPEDVLSYEVGLKSEFLERRVRLNLAAFQTDYTDMQINQFAAGTFGASSIIVNAGEVRLRGLEAELTALPTADLLFDASFGYTAPKYLEYQYRDRLTNALIDVAGEAKVLQSAKFNAHLGAQYSRDLSFGSASVRMDYSYRSEVYFHNLARINPFNETIKSGPDRNLRARISISGVAAAGGTIDLGLWGDNLTNDENIDFAIDFGALNFASGSYKPPRTFGADVKYRF